jgi:nicotinamidase-related amidase
VARASQVLHRWAKFTYKKAGLIVQGAYIKYLYVNRPEWRKDISETNQAATASMHMKACLLLLFLLSSLFSYASCFSTFDNNSNRNNYKMATAATTSKIARHVGKLHPATTAVLLCDVQERFRPLIYRMETVINTCRYMTSVATALDIPIVGTQQYTKVFGATVPDAFADPAVLASTPIYDKKLFSMMTEEVTTKLTELGKRDSYIIMGIEAHVCVQQTCLDLLEAGSDVHVIVDGVSSQTAYDRSIALQRLQSAGAYLTTAQSAAFMLLQSAEHPNFKTVSKLTVEHMKLPNEFNDDFK